MPARIAVTLKDGRTLSRETSEYPGLNGPPLTWKQVLLKFEQLSSGRVEVERCRNLAEAVRNLESIAVSDLTGLLATVGSPGGSRTRDVSSRTKRDGRQ
jgi:2-methylcitrate dehydratase PrpD